MLIHPSKLRIALLCSLFLKCTAPRSFISLNFKDLGLVDSASSQWISETVSLTLPAYLPDPVMWPCPNLAQRDSEWRVFQKFTLLTHSTRFFLVSFLFASVLTVSIHFPSHYRVLPPNLYLLVRFYSFIWCRLQPSYKAENYFCAHLNTISSLLKTVCAPSLAVF